MKKGNWVPLDKRLVSFLPKVADDRPYTKLEAMFSLSVDYDNLSPVSVAGYAKMWKWSRKSVSKFISSIGAEIVYPVSTDKKQNQRGLIRSRSGSRSGADRVADQEQIRIIENSNLEISGTDKEQIGSQIRSRSGSTTIDPDPKPDPKKNINPIKNIDAFLYNMPESIKSKWTEKQIESKTEDLVDYCNRSGKKYKCYYSALRTFLKKDFPEGAQKKVIYEY